MTIYNHNTIYLYKDQKLDLYLFSTRRVINVCPNRCYQLENKLVRMKTRYFYVEFKDQTV